MLIAADPSTMLRSKSMRPGHRSNMGECPGAWNSRDAELHRNAPLSRPVEIAPLCAG
jgi:hypothetical protein